MIWWGDFMNNLKDYSLSTDHGYCECVVKSGRNEKCFEYKIHASTSEKYFSMIFDDRNI